ncbi:MAG: hypothetical protein JWM11_6124, partial [Planctomycetaceae bacterium]|nr:hypothetical protein [Planctomycetaceae bacterium]
VAIYRKLTTDYTDYTDITFEIPGEHAFLRRSFEFIRVICVIRGSITKCQ